ncbi:MAG: molybdopterin-dependent oxidoreductase [Gemmatimonadaceae bacterium]|nr:molybdopterin-dependent oxidoreductase [Gemmatimonadaceae bacterium]
MPQHVSTCSLCEAMCGIVIETEGDRVIGIRGDPDDTFSRGHICPKAVALGDVHADPDRLRRPMVRYGTHWGEVSWEHAFDLVTKRLTEIQATHGANAVAVYAGNPTIHSLGASMFFPDFVRALGTKNRFSATSVDQLPHHLAAVTMFGHPLLIPIPDIDHTDHLLIFGANPAVSNGSLMTAPDVVKRLKAIRARGGRVVLVDPRRTETAALATEHHFVRPGADALVLLALLHVVFAERLERLGRVGDFTDGLDAVRALVATWTPERVAPLAGLSASAMRTMARDFCAAPRAVAYGRVGVSMQEFGALSCWLISVLNVVTGRLDAEGGSMFTRPAVDLVAGAGLYSGGRFGRWHSRVRGLPEFGGELPVAALAEEIETPGEGQVRALVTHAGNPVLSTPNGIRLDRALDGLEFMVSFDFYVNETTRHADVILPPAFALERDHYDTVFHVLAIRNTAKFSNAVFAPADGAKQDWEILSEMTSRLRRGTPAEVEKARDGDAKRAVLGPRGMLNIGLRAGPYGAASGDVNGGLSLAALEASPHGVDLGALAPCLPDRLRTEAKRIALAPETIVADVARLERVWVADSSAPVGALSLIGRRDLRSNNSWMHNSERLARGKRRCTLLMHSLDAAGRGLTDGTMVLVASRVGDVAVELETTEDIMPGVVCLPHGWGHGRPGVQMRVAQSHAGVSINDLTDDQRVDVLSGNAAFSGTLVTVVAAAPAA